jgi:hypothetical protein
VIEGSRSSGPCRSKHVAASQGRRAASCGSASQEGVLGMPHRLLACGTPPVGHAAFEQTQPI